MDLNATISDKMLQMSMEEKDEGLGTTATTASNNSSSNLSNFFLDRRAPGRNTPYIFFIINLKKEIL